MIITCHQLVPEGEGKEKRGKKSVIVVTVDSINNYVTVVHLDTILYSGNFLREKTFVNCMRLSVKVFSNLLFILICKVFFFLKRFPLYDTQPASWPGAAVIF